MRQRVLVGCLTAALCSVVACGNGGDGSGADASFSGDKYTLTWGPVTVAPGREDTQCIWMRLGNESEIRVHQMHNRLNDASHHLIVYKDDLDVTEQAEPVPCQPFTGAINATGMIAPVAITQKEDDMIFLPERVGYTFAPNQMIKLEMHYLNRGDAQTSVEATVDFYAAKPGEVEHEAAILFTGTPDINIAAGAMAEVHQFFTMPPYLDFSKSKIFAITGHTHQYGTAVEIAVAPSKTGPMTALYAPTSFSWTEPETKTFEEPFSIPVGGGFDMKCAWHNTSNSAVGFGESANEEMCFFWAYYYPSQGSKVCFHTEQLGGVNGVNVCCPGDNLCSFLEDYLN